MTSSYLFGQLYSTSDPMKASLNALVALLASGARFSEAWVGDVYGSTFKLLSRLGSPALPYPGLVGSNACASSSSLSSLRGRGRGTRGSILVLRSIFDNSEIEKMKEQAQKLREEIAEFQKSKDDLEEAARQEKQEELDRKQAYFDQYSGVVPILKPDGTTVEEKVQFPPLWKVEGKAESDKTSTVHVIEAPLPLGVILGEAEENPGLVVVDDIAEGSNAAAAGVQIGDLVRACTACRVEMDQTQTWQLLVGGIGQPKTVRFMFGTDGKPLEEVLGALGSNRMDPVEGRPVVIVVERPPEGQ